MTPATTAHPQRFWDARAACNFIGGGTGTGLLVFAALGALAGSPYFLPGLVGLAFVAVGLLMVWFEIGKPWRALNVFVRPQTSWMSRESILAVALFAIGAVALSVAWTESSGTFDVGPALLTAVVGVGFLACQLGMLRAVRGVPAWRERMLMPLVGLSGFAEGLGLYLMFTVVWDVVSRNLLVVALGLIIARAVAWQVYLKALSRSDVPAPTLAVFRGIRNTFLLGGHGLPAVLIGLAFIWPEPAGLLVALAGGGMVAAGWLFKLVLITRAAYTRGFSLPVIPARGGGTGTALSL